MVDRLFKIKLDRVKAIGRHGEHYGFQVEVLPLSYTGNLAGTVVVDDQGRVYLSGEIYRLFEAFDLFSANLTIGRRGFARVGEAELELFLSDLLAEARPDAPGHRRTQAVWDWLAGLVQAGQTSPLAAPKL